MKLFFRALLLAVLGTGAIGGGLLWTYSSTTNASSDPQTLALQVFLVLGALVFGAYALLQAQEDYAGYKKTNKKPNKALNAVLILLAILVLAFAGYKAWQGTQPIDVTVTYLNATTDQPIAGATLYFMESAWGNGQRPQVRQAVTDAQGHAGISVPRNTYYSIYEKPPGDVPGPALGQIEPYGISGTQYEIIVYAGEPFDPFGYSTPYTSDSTKYTVHVIDAQRQPIAGADVTFYTSSGAGTYISSETSTYTASGTRTTVSTDANGQAQLDDNTYGPISVFVSKDGYESQVGIGYSGSLTLVLLRQSA